MITFIFYVFSIALDINPTFTNHFQSHSDTTRTTAPSDTPVPFLLRAQPETTLTGASHGGSGSGRQVDTQTVVVGRDSAKWGRDWAETGFRSYHRPIVHIIFCVFLRIWDLIENPV